LSDVELDYPALMDSALRGVVRDVLNVTRELGAAPGEHHFYIEFATPYPGVSLPDHLRQSYPDRMTIVLQHQFKDLDVEDDKFEVTLWFKGEPARLVVPFDAVTVFADPSAEFELRFAAPDGEVVTAATDAPAPGETGPGDDEKEREAADDEAAAEKGADVVSLDSFRKK